MPTAALNAGIIQPRNAFTRYGKDGKRSVWLIILNYQNSSLSGTIQIYTCTTKKRRRGKECFAEGDYSEKKYSPTRKAFPPLERDIVVIKIGIL